MNFQSTRQVVVWRNDAGIAAARQRFLKALMFSLAVHAIVLLHGHSLPQPRKAAQPLIGTLRAVESASPPAPAEMAEPQNQLQPSAPKPQPPVPRKIPRKPVIDGKSRQVHLPLPEPAPADAQSDTAKLSRGSAGDEVPFSLASPASSSPNPGLDPNAIRRYRLALASAARRFKVYPRLAQERGWVGTAEIRVTVFADPRPPQVELAKSSGFAVLDNQACEMLARAVQHTALPEALSGREFSEVLPVKFDLSSE